MQITLKQGEIERAVAAYIVSQGFNLKGKTVTQEFTAGRGEKGLMVDIFIEDEGTAPAAAPAPVKVETAAPAKAPAPTSTPAPAPAAETPAAAPAAAGDEAAAPAPKSSLFGG